MESLNLLKLLKNYGTQEQYTYLLECMRWGDKRTCPRCGSLGVWKQKSASPGREIRWNCSDCRHHFSVTAGTIFHNTQLNFQGWFDILYYKYGTDKNPSGWEISKLTGIPRSTVWKILRRIKAVIDRPEEVLLRKILEQYNI